MVLLFFLFSAVTNGDSYNSTSAPTRVVSTGSIQVTHTLLHNLLSRIAVG